MRRRPGYRAASREIDKPHTRVTGDLDEIGSPNLTEVLSRFAKDRGIG